MLNIVHDNLDKHPIRYMNSEAGEQELAERLEKFAEPEDYWDTVDFVERSTNFADIILPTGLNIIDYMELDPERTYMVTQYIRDIHDKLTTGVAVIALQKKSGNAFGIGGEGSLEKPRLYITMENHKMTIQKGKIWRQPDYNPNGLVRDYKLVQGCKFLPDSAWDMPDEKPFGKRY
jgi:hypothetical protein